MAIGACCMPQYCTSAPYPIGERVRSPRPVALVPQSSPLRPRQRGNVLTICFYLDLVKAQAKLPRSHVSRTTPIVRTGHHLNTTYFPLVPHDCDTPRYFIKFPFAVLLGIWSAIFWRKPTAEDVVTFIEGTSLVTVLRRDRAADQAAVSVGETNLRASEKRHYYICVDECKLEHVSRERGSKYNEGVVTPIKSWSMKYSKTRCSGEDGKWEVNIASFLVNGEPVADSESQVSFLHFYWTTAAHTKCHALGNSLVERIVSDENLKTKLIESTWTTTWLHHGLLHGTLGPLTTTRCRGRST